MLDLDAVDQIGVLRDRIEARERRAAGFRRARETYMEIARLALESGDPRRVRAARAVSEAMLAKVVGGALPYVTPEEEQ